jgi:Ca2+/Na+ antiporter
MSGISSLFVDPSDIVGGFPGSVQLLFLICVYGYILYISAKLIADGSELLSVVLDPGLVGGLLLPVMGAVPDCAIVLFSGLGDDAQNQLKVGVGTLAGSTIMLLTLPWFACAFVGRVDVIDDSTDKESALLSKGKKSKGPSCAYTSTPKLTPGLSFWDTMLKTGVQPPTTVKGSAVIMICSAFAYLIIQGPAFALSKDSLNDAAKAENNWALAGLIVSSLMFAAFSAYCVFSASAIELQKARLIASRKEAVNRKLVSMVSLLRIEDNLDKDDSSSSAASDDILKSLFSKYDLDGNGTLDIKEVKNMLHSLSIRISSSEIKTVMEEYGGDDKLINESEFVGLAKSMASRQSTEASRDVVVKEHGALQSGGEEKDDEEDDDDDEEEEEEEENGNLTKFQILTRSCGTLLLGVGMCVVFSDPMVDALTEVGNRWGISPFYISFIITPVVSNASELLSSLQFAAKKTRRSIDMTYQQLLGASTMNNTLCLSVFLVLVYARKLAWEFSAEVLTILTVEIVVFVVTYTSKNSILPLWKAAIPLLCFPLSLVMVWVLENVVGLN